MQSPNESWQIHTFQSHIYECTMCISSSLNRDMAHLHSLHAHMNTHYTPLVILPTQSPQDVEHSLLTTLPPHHSRRLTSGMLSVVTPCMASSMVCVCTSKCSNWRSNWSITWLIYRSRSRAMNTITGHPVTWSSHDVILCPTTFSHMVWWAQSIRSHDWMQPHHIQSHDYHMM